MVLATSAVLYPADAVDAAMDNGLPATPAATATCHSEHWHAANSRAISSSPIS